MILSWDLFSTSESKFIGKDMKFEDVNDEGIISSVARVPGKFIAINTDGDVSSIFDKLIDYVGIEEKGLELYSIVIHSDKVKKGHLIRCRLLKLKLKKAPLK